MHYAQEKTKIDGVSVVGDFVILESDIDKMIVEMESQGYPPKILPDVNFWGS